MTTVVNHLIYDAFGRATSESNPAIDSLFLFTDRPFDTDTQLQNNLNRWYDARVGRWLSEDPIGFGGPSGWGRVVRSLTVNDSRHGSYLEGPVFWVLHGNVFHPGGVHLWRDAQGPRYNDSRHNS